MSRQAGFETLGPPADCEQARWAVNRRDRATTGSRWSLTIYETRAKAQSSPALGGLIGCGFERLYASELGQVRFSVACFTVSTMTRGRIYTLDEPLTTPCEAITNGTEAWMHKTTGNAMVCEWVQKTD
jgi:hypothetical protein